MHIGMPNPGAANLMQAVAAYKQRAGARLQPEQVQEAVRLLKEVNRRLPGRNLLEASRDELKAAGTRLFADGEPRQNGPFLTFELREFFDAALAAGIVLRHPLTGEARLGPTPGEDSGVTRQEAAQRAAKLVAGIIEESIQKGLLLSPLAAPVAEAGDEPDTFLERLLSGLSGRWQLLARSLCPVLRAARVVVPLAAVVISLSAALDAGNPLNARANSAFATGEAVRRLELAVNLAQNQEWDEQSGISSLEELGERVGLPLPEASEVFDLEKIVTRPYILYLRHRQSGTLVILGLERRATLRQGTWRVLR